MYRINFGAKLSVLGLGLLLCNFSQGAVSGESKPANVSGTYSEKATRSIPARSIPARSIPEESENRSHWRSVAVGRLIALCSDARTVA